MEKIALTKNGPEVSTIIAGVWKWGEWGHKLSIKEQEDLILECLDMGVTTFDHADIYGNHMAEEEFGKAFKTHASRRSEMQLITKCGIKMPSSKRKYHIKSYDTSKDHIIWSVENSLINLGTDYLDLVLIHRPSPLMHPDEIAEAVRILKKQGKVLHFGVSNFTYSQFELLNSRIDIVTNQIQASLLHLKPFLDGTMDQMLQHRIRPTVWSPLGSGALFRMAPKKEIAAIANEAKTLLTKYDVNRLDQIYLAWLMRHPAKPIPIMGTARPHRMRAAIEACSIEMSREDWFCLWTAATGAEVP